MSKSIITDLAQFYTRNNTNEMGNHMTQELFFCLFTFSIKSSIQCVLFIREERQVHA